jgi:hypothetical protein
MDGEEPDRRIPGLERVALCAARGSSHLVGEPGIGDIDEEFDRWFVKQLEQTELGNLLDMPKDELMEAGNGTGQLGRWLRWRVPCVGACSQPSQTSRSTSGSTGWAS